MPMYEFHCTECSLVFEDLVEKEEADSTECESCGGKAEKKISDFGFKFDSGKMEDGTIGVDSVDNDVDKVIGRDAERRWEQVKDRERRKRKVARSETGREDAHMKRVPNREDYEVLSDEELNKANHLHKQRKEFKEQAEKGEEEVKREETSSK